MGRPEIMKFQLCYITASIPPFLTKNVFDNVVLRDTDSIYNCPTWYLKVWSFYPFELIAVIVKWIIIFESSVLEMQRRV